MIKESTCRILILQPAALPVAPNVPALVYTQLLRARSIQGSLAILALLLEAFYLVLLAKFRMFSAAAVVPVPRASLLGGGEGTVVRRVKW